MDNISRAMARLSAAINQQEVPKTIPFHAFIELLTEKPHQAVRNVFQVFYDMTRHYLDAQPSPNGDDGETSGLPHYDCTGSS